MPREQLLPQSDNGPRAAETSFYLGPLTSFTALEVTNFTAHGDGAGPMLGGLEIVSSESTARDARAEDKTEIYDPACGDQWG